MELSAGVTKAGTVISSANGVIVVRITLHDESENPLPHQPSGRFQVWQVTGEVKLIKPCSSPEEAEGYLTLEASLFRQIDEQEQFDVERLEAEAASHTVTNIRNAADCFVELLFVRDGMEHLLDAQFKRQNRKCTISANIPRLVKGLALDDDPPRSSEKPTKRTKRQGPR